MCLQGYKMKNSTSLAGFIILITVSSIFLMGCTDSSNNENNKNAFSAGKDDTLYKGFSVEWGGRTENKDYVLLIKAVDTKNLITVDQVFFTLYSPDRRDMSNGQHSVVDVYDKPIDDKTFISFRDGDHDGMLSIGDRFIIKSVEHVDDDGSTDSPGLAEAGFFFEVRVGQQKIFEEQIN